LVIKYILNSNPCGGYRDTKSFTELRVSSRAKLISQNKLESGIKQYKVFVSQNYKGFGDSERGHQPDKLGNKHSKKRWDLKCKWKLLNGVFQKGWQIYSLEVYYGNGI